jgi:hypothetical protein
VPVSIGGDAVSTGTPGLYTVRYSAQDDSGNSSYLDRNVTVVDRTPPTLSAAVSPQTVWPPNHNLISIVPTLIARDACDQRPAVTLVGITSSDSPNAQGDGNTNPDIVVDAQGNIFLRAERAGSSKTRVYTLTFQAKDASNNVTRATATVTVTKP